MFLYNFFFSIGPIAISSSHFGPGTGSIVLNSVRCLGSERRLIDCPSGAVTYRCNHNRDAGVRCLVQTGF